jgi:hypothetical protein
MVLTLVIATFASILVGTQIGSYHWSVQSVLWFALAFIISLQFKSSIQSRTRNAYFITAISYLVLESIIKILLYYTIVPGSWVFFNSIEHLLWSFAFGLLIYYYLKPRLIRLDDPNLAFLLFVGIVNLTGIGNEFVEYFLREMRGLESIVYYPDTIRDMLMNVIGSTVSYLVLKFVEKRYSKNPLN